MISPINRNLCLAVRYTRRLMTLSAQIRILRLNHLKITSIKKLLMIQEMIKILRTKLGICQHCQEAKHSKWV